ncbi:hypothetical protein AB3G45_21625 [Shinella sp. S4-D37]|uniref:hypothetical protein n=1 Tax=Shinella sp. S4-D37 TaxID=3161999 RepID=UPI0034676CD8
MRQFLFVLAILGAVLSGWVPAIAATQHAAQTGMHAGHPVAGAAHGKAEQDRTNPAVHPMACSACFAIETAGPQPLQSRIGLSHRFTAAVRQLAGLALRPLDPPPRS